MSRYSIILKLPFISVSYIFLIVFTLSLVSCKKDYTGINDEWVVSNFIIDDDTVNIEVPIFKLILDKDLHYSYNGPQNYHSSGSYSLRDDHIQLLDSINVDRKNFYIVKYQENQLILIMDNQGKEQIVTFTRKNE